MIFLILEFYHHRNPFHVTNFLLISVRKGTEKLRFKSGKSVKSITGRISNNKNDF